MFFNDLKFTNKNNLMWLMAYIRLPEHLEQYYREYERGEMPSDPVVYCVIPGLMDPSLVTSAEGHTCTIFSHYYTRGKHNEYRDLMAERVIDRVARYAPNFRDAIVNKVVFTHPVF